MYYLVACVGFRSGARSYSQRHTNAPAILPETNSTLAAASKDFNGHVAIITGGGTGLGRAIALNLARRGAKVVIASRDKTHLDSVASEIAACGGQSLTFSLDVRDPERVEALVKQTIERFGRIDILVNNAAGNFLVPAEKLTPNGWNAVVGIVLNGTWYCSSAVGREMIKQGSGCILNIVANYAWSGQPGVVHSASAKAGVLAMTRTLAVEWGRYGIRVNALAPGAMVTQGASSNLKFDTPEAQETIRKRVPLRRLTTPEEMANLAVFLCSKDAAYINGDVLTADGGAWLPRGFFDLYDPETPTK
ncbi:MAG: 2,4-dienoyl-CoA reductase [Candidatus Melainabacteria bacterium]|nr:2,4-dienoyl-CoA reductase [Candidatus Melainabacteria bacterium]